MRLHRKGEVLDAEIVEHVGGEDCPWIVLYENGLVEALSDSELTHSMEVAELLTDGEIASEYAASLGLRLG